jgi:hypothetical protein
MNTTVSLDRDAFAVVKDFAAASKKTPRQILSELVRKNLRPKAKLVERNGFLLISKIKGGKPVTLDMVNRLRDEDP